MRFDKRASFQMQRFFHIFTDQKEPDPILIAKIRLFIHISKFQRNFLAQKWDTQTPQRYSATVLQFEKRQVLMVKEWVYLYIYIYKYIIIPCTVHAIFLTVALQHCSRILKTCFFCAYFGLLFGRYAKNSYLCIVNEKR